MPLSIPNELQTIIDAGHCEYNPFVELYLNGGITLRYSVANISADGNSYDDRLKNISGGKSSLSSSIDRLTFTLYNADAIVGQQMLATRTPLERIKALVGTVYVSLIDPNQKWRIIEDDGIVNAGSATDTEVECTFISYTYSEESICGDIKIEVDCGYKYKDPRTCGYAGSIATCDRTFAGVNGCTAHFEFDTARLQFGGHAMFLDDAYVQQVKKVTPSVIYDEDGVPIYKNGKIRRIYAKKYFYDL